MEILNSDIVLEIFSRLPIKSILQCRNVCRIWRSLLGKPKAGMLFANRPNYWGPTGLCYRDQASDQTVKFTEEHQNFYKIVTKISTINIGVSSSLVGSCHGLVCYKAIECILPLGRDVIYVFNPITGEQIRLPQMDAYYVCAAGFGYCQQTDAYKVVVISNTENGQRYIQVYTLGDGSSVWRDKPKITYMLRESGVFANGALHWLQKSNLIRENYKFDIVGFDVADETFRLLPLPRRDIPSSSYMDANLGSLEGNLCLCLCYLNQGEHMMDIWVFKKRNMNNCRRSSRLNYFNSFIWINVFRRKWSSGSIRKCQPLYLTKSEILVLQNGVLSCYDLKTLTKLWYADGARADVQAIPHMHSLVSMKNLGEELVDW